MTKLISILIFLSLFFSVSYSKEQQEAYHNDYLYSEEYFDYLIECAEKDRDELVKKENNAVLNDEIKLDDVLNTGEADEIISDYEPFKLHIQTSSSISPYGETFKKIDSKTIIPVSDSFGFYQNMSKTRNKYNSNDYKILAGVQYTPFDFLNIETGLETNFRGLDQNPTSRKLYVTPNIYITDVLTLSFYNKMNVYSYSTDHDIGLTLSPFKSKAMDFGVYAGLTRNSSGYTSKSINFSTNYYFF